MFLYGPVWIPLITLKRSVEFDCIHRIHPRCWSTHTRLQVYEYGSGDVSRIIRLIEEDILAVTALGRKVLQVPILANSVLLTELLPELTSNCAEVRSNSNDHKTIGKLTAVAALAGLNRDNFSAGLSVKTAVRLRAARSYTPRHYSTIERRREILTKR